MPRLLGSLLLPLLVVASSLPAAVRIELATDRPEAIYRSGEDVRFIVSLHQDGRPMPKVAVAYKVIGDGEVIRASGWMDQPAKHVHGTNKPGFLRFEVSFSGGGTGAGATTRPVTASIGAAVEPDKIKPSLPVPDDFDAFWSAQKQLLAEYPAEPTLAGVKSPDEDIEAFDLQIPGGPAGTRVSGYFARPRGAKPRSLPAILYPHSAGVRDSDLPHAIRGARLGAIALDFNAHGIPNGRPKAFYDDLLAGELADHRVRGMQDRQKIYFRQMYLRVLRALDFLTQQPEWNGRTLIVEGSSQGGAQALVAAGLDHRVTLCLASVPALCDLTAPTVGRESGWPKMLRRNADGSFDPLAVEALRYVDVMNHASRIKCRTIVSVGFIDRTCPPSSVYAAFNNIPGTTAKTIVTRPAMGHAFPADLIAAWDDVIRGHIAETLRDGARP